MLVSAGLIALIVWRIDRRQFWETLQSVSLVAVLVLIAFQVLLRGLSALRWHLLVRTTSPQVPLSETTRIAFQSSFLGQPLPGIVGVEALRIIGLARRTGDWAGSVASAVADRLFGLLSLVLMILMGLAIGPAALRDLFMGPVAAALAVVFAAALVLFSPAVRARAERLVPRALLGRVRERADRVYSAFDRYRGRPATLAGCLGLALLFQLLRVVLFFVAALLIGQRAEFGYFLAIVPAVTFVALLPVSISGIGVREAAFVMLFTRFGALPGAAAFTISILVFASGLLSTLPGAISLFAGGRGLEIRAKGDNNSDIRTKKN